MASFIIGAAAEERLYRRDPGDPRVRRGWEEKTDLGRAFAILFGAASVGYGSAVTDPGGGWASMGVVVESPVCTFLEAH
jgi:hypothetical protein